MSDIARTSERLELVPKNCSSYTTENKTNKNTLKSLFWWWWSDCVYFRTNVRSEALLYDWKQNKTEVHISISRSSISVPSLLLLRILLKVIIWCCCCCCYYCRHCHRHRRLKRFVASSSLLIVCFQGKIGTKNLSIYPAKTTTCTHRKRTKRTRY